MDSILETFKQSEYKEKLFSPRDLSDPIYSEFKKRAYPDISTDAFTKTFLDTNEMLYTFVDFVASLINSAVNFYVNKNLYEKGLPVLNNEEVIVLVFKGGNVLKSLYEESIKTTDPFILTKKVNLNGTDKTIQEVYDQDIAPNFKTSDVDYSLYIVTKDNYRYATLYTLAYNSLVDCMDNISKFFDSYFEAAIQDLKIELPTNKTNYYGKSTINQTTKEQLKDYNVILDEIIKIFVRKDKLLLLNISTLNKLLNSCPNLNNKTKKIIGDYNVNEPNNIDFFVNTANNWLNYFDNNVTNIDDLMDLENVISTTYKIMYITKTFKEVENNKNKLLSRLVTKNIQQIIDKISNHMFDIIGYKRKLLVDYNFYTKEKIFAYLKKLSELTFTNESIRENCMLYAPSDKLLKFYKYNHDHHKYSDNDDNYHKYFSIRKKSSVKLSTSLDPFNLTSVKESKDKRVHYITFNNAINMYKGPNNWINFDLLRIKFNAFIKKNTNDVDNIMYTNGVASELDIPSEFIDVSIIPFPENFKDYHVFDLKHHVNFITKEIRNHNIKIIAYSVPDLKIDLEAVLFKQNIFPWEDTKYEKRLKRLIYTIYFTNLYKNKYADAVSMITMLNTMTNYFIKNIQEGKFNASEPIKYIAKNGILEIGHLEGLSAEALVNYQIKNIDTFVGQNIQVSKANVFAGAQVLIEKIILLSHIYNFDVDKYFTFLQKFYAIKDPSKYLSIYEKNDIVALYKKKTLGFFEIINSTTNIILMLINNSNKRHSVMTNYVDNSFALVGGKKNTDDYKYKYKKYKSKYLGLK